MLQLQLVSYCHCGKLDPCSGPRQPTLQRQLQQQGTTLTVTGRPNIAAPVPQHCSAGAPRLWLEVAASTAAAPVREGIRGHAANTSTRSARTHICLNKMGQRPAHGTPRILENLRIKGILQARKFASTKNKICLNTRISEDRA